MYFTKKVNIVVFKNSQFLQLCLVQNSNFFMSLLNLLIHNFRRSFFMSHDTSVSYLLGVSEHPFPVLSVRVTHDVNPTLDSLTFPSFITVKTVTPFYVAIILVTVEVLPVIVVDVISNTHLLVWFHLLYLDEHRLICLGIP